MPACHLNTRGGMLDRQIGAKGRPRPWRPTDAPDGERGMSVGRGTEF